MEKRITNKVETHIQGFKDTLTSYLENNMDMDDTTNIKLLGIIDNYKNLSLDKTDFTKRKRVKTEVPIFQRCIAKRACGAQCTRKRRDSITFCGTHEKNRPHGVIENDKPQDVSMKKIQIKLTEINGISYYIDEDNNVYKTEDILTNNTNPKIIAKYEKINGNYKLLKT